MKLYSWNVNGLRAALKKNFLDWLLASGADVVCLQETKATPEQISEADREPDAFSSVWCSSTVKKGYSGVATYFRQQPLSHSQELPDPAFQGEGRLLLCEYPEFYLFNIYFPNGQMNEERLQYKLGYYDAFLAYAEELRKQKPIVVCGDFNTAHTEIDLARPKQNEDTSGFLPIERAWLDKLVAHGYLDTFRMFDTGPDNYTWWSFRANARAKNVGWRIDYFFISSELKDNVTRAWIEPDVTGSDHCPLGLELTF